LIGCHNVHRVITFAAANYSFSQSVTKPAAYKNIIQKMKGLLRGETEDVMPRRNVGGDILLLGISELLAIKTLGTFTLMITVTGYLRIRSK